MSGAWLIVWLCTAGLAACSMLFRWMFIVQSAALRVDHHYWGMMAQAYRECRRLPAVLRGKYLLEPSEQAYPPFFGMLLARLSQKFLAGNGSIWLIHGVDAVVAMAGCVLALQLGASLWSLPVIVALVGFAPILVSYNVQLNPRAFGNLFLVLKFLAEASAASLPFSQAWPLWLLAVLATACIWLTHKMTTQLMLVLWLPWGLALQSPCALLVLPAGMLAAALLAGPGYFAYQLAAHLDILRFWNRHWSDLGVHGVRGSPLYGDPKNVDRSATLHRPGLKGKLGYLTLVIGYVPMVLLLPFLLLLPWPPLWLLVWALGTVAWALLTLFVPRLRAFGGGHLYMFNAVMPLALWSGLSLDAQRPITFIGPILMAAGSCAALLFGWFKRQRYRREKDAGFSALLDFLKSHTSLRLAVFPLVAAETIAAETPHAVLWGAHGYGFDAIEPVFPVLRQRVGAVATRRDIRHFAWDSNYWPQAEAVLQAERGIISLQSFGSWRFAVLQPTTMLAPCRIVVIGTVPLAAEPNSEIFLLRQAKAAPLSVGSLAAKLRQIDPDMIYIETEAGLLPSLLAVLLSGKPRAMIGMTRPVRWLRQFVPALAPALLCASAEMAQIARNAGLAPERIFVGPITVRQLSHVQNQLSGLPEAA